MRKNRLLALLAANQTRPKRYEIQAAADEATVYLYDVIDPFWGVSAAQFVRDLNALQAPVIHLRINSPGGDVFEGRAIATAIQQHKAKIIAHVDGIAASAASFIAIAAREVEMGEGSFLMIHRAWTYTYGNAADLVEQAAVLEKIDGTLVDTYVKRSGQTAEQVREWLDGETYFTAEEAVANGFADRVAATPAAGEQSRNVANEVVAAMRQQLDEPEPALIAAVATNHEADVAHAERMRRARL